MAVDPDQAAHLLDVLKRASAGFGETVQQIGDDQWEVEIPGFVDWTVLTATAHVVIGAAHATAMLKGDDATPLLTADASILGTAPMPTWRGTAIAEIQAFSEPGALDQTVPHPVGDIPAELQLGFRVTENIVHGYDIANALGLSLTRADDLAEFALAVWQPHTNLLVGSDHFGPTQTVDVDAAPLDRLLALLGRRPA